VIYENDSAGEPRMMMKANVVLLCVAALLLLAVALAHAAPATEDQPQAARKSKNKFQKTSQNVDIPDESREKLRQKLLENPEYFVMLQKALTNDPTLDRYSPKFQAMLVDLSALLPPDLQKQIDAAQQEELRRTGAMFPHQAAAAELSEDADTSDIPLADEFQDEL
jgi:hypothetical protein